jgi:hypothetical protein
MPITVTCGGCGTTLKVKDELAGRKGKCPGCGAVLTIPAADTEATSQCPTCGGPLPPSAVMCVNCGTNVQTGDRVTAPGPPRLDGLRRKQFTARLLTHTPLYVVLCALLIAGLCRVLEADGDLPEVTAGLVVRLFLLSVCGGVVSALVYAFFHATEDLEKGGRKWLLQVVLFAATGIGGAIFIIATGLAWGALLLDRVYTGSEPLRETSLSRKEKVLAGAFGFGLYGFTVLLCFFVPMIGPQR